MCTKIFAFMWVLVPLRIRPCPRPKVEVEVEVEGAGEHEAALGTVLVRHRHQLASVRLEIIITNENLISLLEQYFLTSSNTDSLKSPVTLESKSLDGLVEGEGLQEHGVHRDPEGLEEEDQLLRVQVSERGVHQHRDAVEDNINNNNDDKNQTCQ